MGGLLEIGKPFRFSPEKLTVVNYERSASVRKVAGIDNQLSADIES